MLPSLLLLLLLLLPWLATAGAAASDIEIAATGSVDLSARGLSGTARLQVRPLGVSRVALDLLNVSRNPGLERIQLMGSLHVMQVNTLDLSGTSVMPTDQLIHFAQPQTGMLSVRHVFINWTALPPEQPLQFPAFTDLLYRLRAQSFALSNWTVAAFDANFSQADNACQSKKFDSVGVNRAGLLAIANATVSATRSVDLSHNAITRVVNVTFHSGSVDLSHNAIASLANVSFQPGTFCRTLITGPPEVSLADNAITMTTLLAGLLGAADAPSQPVLRGLDLSRNPLLLPLTLPTPPMPDQRQRRRIRIVDWLRLASVATTEAAGRRLLADDLLLGHFEPAAGSQQPLGLLDLSGNWLGARGLAGLAAVLARDGGPLRVVHLRLSGCSFAAADHLNLSELAPVGIEHLDLGDLSADSGGGGGSRVRSVSATVSLPALRRLQLPPDFDFLQAQLPGSVAVRPRPGGCCAAQGTDQLFCFLRPLADREYRRLVCGGGDDGGGGGTTDATEDDVPRPTRPLLVALGLLVAALAIVAVVVVALYVRRLRRRRRCRWLRRRPSASSPGDALRSAKPPLAVSSVGDGDGDGDGDYDDGEAVGEAGGLRQQTKDPLRATA